MIRQCNGYHHFLTFTFGQLIGKTAHRIFVIFNPHAVQQFNGTAFAPAKTLPPTAFIGPGWDVLHQLATHTF
ncbi:Uncharacterised protein [Shigella sonnei]|nr:Uncharacterised protein [Shigella sonnei]